MQTRCGTGTKDLTKREKSALYYEIALSKPWCLFCDRCVEVELENILKETFGDDYGGDVWAFDSIKVIASPKNVSIDYEIRPSLCWGHILCGRPDDPDVFKKMMLTGYKRFVKYVEYRLLLAHTKARSAESLAEYAESQVWELDERGELKLCLEH